ncbi:MAG: bifunctional chorismate mutase/prephenate dehydratase [Oligosphaeraceae bacterium]
MDLSDCRHRIDEIDDQLLKLFTERMAISREVAGEKIATGKPVLVPERERDIMRRISEEAGPEMSNDARMLFNTILDLSRSVQYRMMHKGRHCDLGDRIREAIAKTPDFLPPMPNVACCGIDGSYAYQAAEKAFNHLTINGFKNFEGVAQAVKAGLCQYGVLPIENSTFGTVKPVNDLLAKYGFYIVRALKLHVRHALLVKPGTRLEDIREISSHEQAVGQCGEFLRSLKSVTVISGDNTAVAARKVAESPRRDVAAIASPMCAELYGLEILKEDIQDNANNYTRFICISRNMEIYPGANRISVTLRLPHRVGSLSRFVSRFAALGLNLVKLESAPLPGSDFEFTFYFDFEASVRSAGVTELLEELSVASDQFAFLGNYIEL